jgi:DegV family protein with EDD domain
LEENFRELLNAGAESILFISLSGKLSSSYNMAVLAAKSVQNEFPDREIVVLDSRRVSFAEGSVVLAAASAGAEGKSMPEVIETAQNAIPRCGLVGALSTLEYVIRGGRLSEFSYLLNSIINVIPVVAVNGKGNVSPISITRSEKQAMKAMINYVAKKVNGEDDLHLAVLHAAAKGVAARFREMVQKELNPLDVTQIEFTPVMGAHAGPGFFGLSYYYE